MITITFTNNVRSSIPLFFWCPWSASTVTARRKDKDIPRCTARQCFSRGRMCNLPGRPCLSQTDWIWFHDNTSPDPPIPIQRPVLNRLRQVLRADRLRRRQVRYRPTHFQDPIIRPRTQAQPVNCHLHQLLPLLV